MAQNVNVKPAESEAQGVGWDYNGIIAMLPGSDPDNFRLHVQTKKFQYLLAKKWKSSIIAHRRL